METDKLKPRPLYLNRLISLKDLETVKIITGIRRCGKSSLLKLMAAYLAKSGISTEQIISINFESYSFSKMSADMLYEYVKAKSAAGKRRYLFFDELQRIDKWETAINAMRADLDCDIYITGSNAYLLSSEYSTYLSGRCVEVKMLPLSFMEFASFRGLKIKQGQNFSQKHFQDKNGKSFTLREVFDDYMRIGGMPGAVSAGLSQENVLTMLDGIYSTVVVRDIMERSRRRGSVNDAFMLRKIIMFLADNIGSSVSFSSIGNALTDAGLVSSGRGRKGKAISAHTAANYINALAESYFFYEAKRFDIKGKEFLKTLGKYYISDIGLRNYLLGFRDRDSGHALENIAYFELLRRGYDVAIGKTGNREIDFIANKAEERLYIQITQSMISEETRQRELAPLKNVKDNYLKMVLSLEPGLDKDYDGIKSLNILDWLTE